MIEHKFITALVKVVAIVMCVISASWLFLPSLENEFGKKEEPVVERVTDPELDSMLLEEKRVNDSVNIALRKLESARIIEEKRASVRITQEEYNAAMGVKDAYETHLRLIELRRQLKILQDAERDDKRESLGTLP